MTNPLEELEKKFRNGEIDEIFYNMMKAALQAQSTAATGDDATVVQGKENVTATEGSIAVGRSVGGHIITGEGHTVTTIINNFAAASQVEVDEATLREQIADYLRWVVDHHGTIELRGIKRKGEQVVQLDLETVYVPLAAKAARGGKELSLDNVLPLGNLLVITGGPGSGKTTVLQHLVHTLARAIGTENAALAKEKLGLKEPLPLPIFVPLSHFALYRRNLPPDAPGERKTLAAFIVCKLGLKPPPSGGYVPTCRAAR